MLTKAPNLPKAPSAYSEPHANQTLRILEQYFRTLDNANEVADREFRSLPFRTANTITGFNSAGVSDKEAILFLGRDAVNDGGGGWFIFSSTSTATADGGTVFAPTGGGRLLRDGWAFGGLLSRSTTAFAPQYVLRNSAADPYSGYYILDKDRSAAIINSQDAVGTLLFRGFDGSQYQNCALVTANIDGTPGLNSMPGRLSFSTTPSGSTASIERMRINSKGNVGIGSDAGGDSSFVISKNITGALTGYGVRQTGTILSDVTSTAYSILSSPNTQAAAFTLTSLLHFHASQGVIGAGSTISNQYGFHASANLISATNNFGFFSAIPAGTARWNFYADGNARNYFAGGIEVLAGTTTQTAGFINIPAAAGAPTGVPTNPPGNVPLYYDTTNNRIYVYNGAWRATAALT